MTDKNSNSEDFILLTLKNSQYLPIIHLISHYVQETVQFDLSF